MGCGSEYSDCAASKIDYYNGSDYVGSGKAAGSTIEHIDEWIISPRLSDSHI